MDVLMSPVTIADKVKLLIDYIKVVRGLKNWLVLQKQIEKKEMSDKIATSYYRVSILHC